MSQQSPLANALKISATAFTLAVLLSCSMPHTRAQSATSDSALQASKIEVRPSRPVGKSDHLPETLLVLLKGDADREEVATLIRETKGTVVSTIGEGPMTTLVIQTEPGQLAETEKKFAGTSNFSAMQRSFTSVSQATPPEKPDDPYFSSQWYLGAIKIPGAWKSSTGRKVTIAILDTGCQASNTDIAGRVYQGLDYTANKTPVPFTGNTDGDDKESHGTCVATIAAATTNNKSGTAGIACEAYIYPMKIASRAKDGTIELTEQNLINAIYQCGNKGIRVCNVSFASKSAATSMANKELHPVLHAWLKWYHERNGIAIFAAGNNGEYDKSELSPNMVMVSCTDSRSKRTKYSNYGKCIWFTAPGEVIVCSNKRNSIAHMSGTSYAAPQIAALAAMIIAKNPNMMSADVEKVMINNCINIKDSKWNVEFGYGMPDATRALGSTRGMGEEEDQPKEESNAAVPPVPTDDQSFVLGGGEDSVSKENTEKP